MEDLQRVAAFMDWVALLVSFARIQIDRLEAYRTEIRFFSGHHGGYSAIPRTDIAKSIGGDRTLCKGKRKCNDINKGLHCKGFRLVGL